MRPSLGPDTAPAPELSPRIRIRHLSKRYRSGAGSTLALDDVSLDVMPGEKLVLLGPSGCGKTTLLRCVAGLEAPDAGEIEIDGRIVFSAERGIAVRAEHRDISMVFQSYALWPHMTVFDNVAYPLVNIGRRKPEIAARVAEVLAIVGCEAYAQRYPGQLSGGQQQRIALARAIAGNNGTILFDEPLSNVDAKVREQLRSELISLQKRIGCSALYVTHDQSEAMALAHRIAVMQQGRIAQLGRPREIHERPVSRYVADFTGAANAFDAEVTERARGRLRCSTAIGPLTARGEGLPDGERLCMVIRPEHIGFSLQPAQADAENCLPACIEEITFLGQYTELLVSVGGQRLIMRHTDPGDLLEGMRGWVTVAAKHVRLFAASAPGTAS